MLTWDTMFIGDVGRPDLRASLGWTAEDLGGRLYHSLHDKLLNLPDETLVYPAHGAGSLCGKKLSRDTVSSLGDQRRLNYALQPMTKEEFVRLGTANQPDAPSYFTYDAILNTHERVTLDRNLAEVLKPIERGQILRLGETGAQVLDVRDPVEFAKGHLAGSINIGLGGQYATWAGTVQMAAEELSSPTPPLVLDIRNPLEWSTRHIAQCVNIPLNHRWERIDEVPRDRRIAVHCAGGYRSSIAASILHHNGITNLIEVAGGLAAWDAAKLPVVTEG